ncbi:FecR domain-containing protein [Chitinophaga arvensicola]|uniref:FecR protein n=1 Tax=Chitinophaga arvensicola TaxID=29529 RepID=A0A1I0SC59_9BACT|nr:FecR domain-containing protein [Chitinophaga arvensicola]SEW54308.1 FecR protein [Chitinophaga arvensicola]
MNLPEDHQEALLQKYLDGQCSPDEIATLYSWLLTSDAHRPLLAVMQQDYERIMQERSSVPEEISDRIETRLLQSIQITKEKVIPMRVPFRLTWKIAAAVALLVATGVTMLYTLRKPAGPVTAPPLMAEVMPGTNKAVLTLADGSVVTLDSAGKQVIQQGGTLVKQQNGRLQYAAAGGNAAIGYNTLRVPRGGQFTIVLPDGTQAWLNSASSLRYPTAFSGGNRTVEMEGQGYFEVKQNAKQPFIVKVNSMEVQVLGTSFDIMAYPDEEAVKTTLLTGAVKVRWGKAEKLLHPGEQAAVDNSTGEMSVRATDVAGVTAWKTGFFEFDNANINVIMRQLARWYDIEIDTRNADNRLFGGRINRNLPLSEMLKLLETGGAKFNLEGRRLTVIR